MKAVSYIALLASASFVTTNVRAQSQATPVTEAAGPAAGSAGVTSAPDASGSAGPIGDIVVTAQRRAENVQNAGLAITAFGANTLQSRQITSVEALSKAIPDVDFGTFGGAARIAIRGVGFDTINPGAEGRIAYHLDGVYISRPAAQIGTFFDVDRVEVLRGPQGTLYGRNATGGSINVITKKPTDTLDGYVNAGYGNYNRLTFEGAVGGRVANGVRGRIAFETEDHDGWGKNLNTGHDIDNAHHLGGRAQLSFDLMPNVVLDLSGDYYRERDRNYGNHYLGQGNASILPAGLALGGTVPSNPRNIDDSVDPRNSRDFWGTTAHLKASLGSVTLSSITAYRDSRYHLRTELDVTSLPLSIFFFDEKSKQFSQELELSGDYRWGKFVAGAYYFDENIDGGTVIPFNGLLFGGTNVLLQGYAAAGRTHTQAAAAFGQADIKIVDALTFVIGGRYSWERKHINDYGQFDLSRVYSHDNPPLPYVTRQDSTTNTAFTPKFGLEWRPHRALLVYATISEGFKSGGFNLGDNLPAFKPENIWAYEAGLKSTFIDGHVRTNLAGFYYDYSNLQVSKVIGTSVIIVNAASSTIYGLEGDMNIVPFPGIQLDFSGAWLHSAYHNFSTPDPSRPELITPSNPTGTVVLDGNQLTQAPEFSANGGLQYKISVGDGSLTARGEVVYQARVYFTPFNVNQVSRAPNTKLNAFLTYDRAKWSASLYGRNLTGKRTIGNALIASSVVGYPVIGTFDPPRTYGIELAYRF